MALKMGSAMTQALRDRGWFAPLPSQADAPAAAQPQQAPPQMPQQQQAQPQYQGANPYGAVTALGQAGYGPAAEFYQQNPQQQSTPNGPFGMPPEVMQRLRDAGQQQQMPQQQEPNHFEDAWAAAMTQRQQQPEGWMGQLPGAQNPMGFGGQNSMGLTGGGFGGLPGMSGMSGLFGGGGFGGGMSGIGSAFGGFT